MIAALRIFSASPLDSDESGFEVVLTLTDASFENVLDAVDEVRDMPGVSSFGYKITRQKDKEGHCHEAAVSLVATKDVLRVFAASPDA